MMEAPIVSKNERASQINGSSVVRSAPVDDTQNSVAVGDLV